jgi:hypothetical protein
VDVIIVNGIPRMGYGSADIWNPRQRLNHRWRIQEFDKSTGFFSAIAEKQQVGWGSLHHAHPKPEPE